MIAMQPMAANDANPVLGFLNNNSSAITGVATAVLVIVTVVYVVLTRQLVTESRRDRDATYRLLLVWKIRQDQAAQDHKATVVNNSMTGAYSCILVSPDSDSSWLRSKPFDIGNGDMLDVKMVRQDGARPAELDLSVGLGFCQNQFGKMFCITLGKTDAAVWLPSAKRWRRGNKRPEWATWYETELSNYNWV